MNSTYWIQQQNKKKCFLARIQHNEKEYVVKLRISVEFRRYLRTYKLMHIFRGIRDLKYLIWKVVCNFWNVYSHVNPQRCSIKSISVTCCWCRTSLIGNTAVIRLPFRQVPFIILITWSLSSPVEISSKMVKYWHSFGFDWMPNWKAMVIIIVHSYLLGPCINSMAFELLRAKCAFDIHFGNYSKVIGSFCSIVALSSFPCR